MNVTDEEEQMAFMDECKENCVFIESTEISNVDKKEERGFVHFCSSGENVQADCEELKSMDKRVKCN